MTGTELTLVVIAVVVLGLGILALVALMLLRYLRRLGLAVRRTQLRAEQAQRLQVKIGGMQEQIVSLQDKVAQAAEQADLIKAHRGR